MEKINKIHYKITEEELKEKFGINYELTFIRWNTYEKCLEMEAEQ